MRLSLGIRVDLQNKTGLMAQANCVQWGNMPALHFQPIWYSQFVCVMDNMGHTPAL